MNEHELIGRLGMPDEIVGPGDLIGSRAWICFTCGETTISPEPIPCPAPCEHCGGIIYETWRMPGDSEGFEPLTPDMWRR